MYDDAIVVIEQGMLWNQKTRIPLHSLHHVSIMGLKPDRDFETCQNHCTTDPWAIADCVEHGECCAWMRNIVIVLQYSRRKTCCISLLDVFSREQFRRFLETIRSLTDKEAVAFDDLCQAVLALD